MAAQRHSDAERSGGAERRTRGQTMHNKSFAIGLAAMMLAGAFGLAATAANAESVMKECGADWKAAKAAGTTNGQTWNEFLKTCEAQKKGAAPAAAAAPPRPRRPPPLQPLPPLRLRRPRPRPPPRRPWRRPSRRRRRPPLPPRRRRSRRRRPIRGRGRGEGALPERHRRLAQHQVAQVSLLRPQELRHDQAGRLHVRSRRQGGRQRRRQGRTAEVISR